MTSPHRGPRPGLWDPPWSAAWRAGGDRHLRASDQERNEMAETLSRHYADGRLDEAEFKARLDRAMGATTRADLDGLLSDLPPLVEPTPDRRRRPRLVAAALLVIAVVCGLAFVTTPHVPWILIALIAFLLWRRDRRRAAYRSQTGP
jgi:hypothetical protein